MQNKTLKYTALILPLALGASMAAASVTATNRISVSARTGFNLDAGFRYSSSAPQGAPQTTPDGDPYNYDDGYVYPNAGTPATGYTGYWGYDDAAQDTGSEMLMSRTVSSADTGWVDLEGYTPELGVEVTYSHMLEFEEQHRFGFDFSLGMTPLDYDMQGQVQEEDVTTTDVYSYQTGVIIPPAPYQGTLNGAGTLISATPSSSSVAANPGATYAINSELEGYLWSARIGPFIEFPLSEDWTLHVAGGMSLGLVDVEASWKTGGAGPQKGGGRDSDLLSGAFLGADVFWQMKEQWHVLAGVEFEYLNDWEQDFENSTYRLDLTRTVYLSMGVLYSF